MRLSLCALAIASTAIVERCIAAPSYRQTHHAGRTYDSKDISYESDEEKMKYFHEPGNTETLAHYDRRYFNGVVTDEERTDTQSHMIRAYLDFFRAKGLNTWIAHGTLLGWWWNGKRLPWDFDLDTQVSENTLHRLGREFNQSMHKYTSPDGMTKREYLLDVNPWIRERVRGDGMNVIDARWIDVRNGLFIDITGLSETRPEVNPNVWSCKNYHRYETTDLYPMRETMFEGTLAKVPYSYDKILTEEYGRKALVVTNYNGHNWDPNLREWVKSPEKRMRDEAAQRRREQVAKENALERMRLD